MLLKTETGQVLNLAHAFEFKRDGVDGKLTVWWAIRTPSEYNREECAYLSDPARLGYYVVSDLDWIGFCNRNGI